MKRNATDQEKLTGYWLKNWREAYQLIADLFGPATMALYRDVEASLIVEKRIPGGMVASQGKAHLFEACKAPLHVGMGHEEGRKILDDAQVKGITAADLDEIAENFDYAGAFGEENVGQDANGYYIKVYVGGGGTGR